MRTYFSIAASLFHSIVSIFRSRTDLAIENLALRQQLDILMEKGSRPHLTWADRGFWVLLRELCPSNSWRAPELGSYVSERTISRYLPRREPGPDKIQTWKTFLRNHREPITAMDFFTVPTIRFQVLYIWFIIGHDRRTIIHVNVTYHPTAAWVIQQLREAFFFDFSWRYVIFDRDSSFSRLVIETIRSFGLNPARTMYRSPWQNGVAERWIASCRRELVDHVIALSENHLRRLLLEYAAYYNEDRSHYGLGKETPNGRPVQMKPARRAVVVAHPRAGGFHHRYEWRKAA